MQRIVLAASRSKPMRESQKVLFIDRIQNGKPPSILNERGSLLDCGYLLNKGRSVRASDTALTLLETVPAAIAAPAPPQSGNRPSTRSNRAN